ncbi:MAG: sensor histidine kinase N-terminal domain-containing protein [Rubrivivax sp.]|uniref:sensor histidine kinase n=1 Tax=Ottowia sp. TaxID=1898956 RepID=UPI00217A2A64|nr:sensor histidine kinase N-terminal domain-containing protein [Ottowia sp.]MCC6813041.1 sensor histidine kinase N-terminal domain-containing protein [Rubrivivax sp.]MCZ2090437.1 sensor histidine kinase N-terminal domain-containing protein [Burkholderiales bacterium]HNI84125.1 sensor histidine kinase N-terminal domain-containing protein [Ottowia sp.]HNJ45098.1 sensor histidine kinase N-terminal domain-containing protein [Ottowia sp.]HNL42108.1 sensor histidine kinase N-terminal domain-contain
MKLFQRNQRSLFGEILDWMLTPLLLLWPISLALTWLVAQNLANKPFDRALVYNVQALAQFIQVGPRQRARFSLPQPASELLRADDADNVYFQVMGAHGEFLAGERELPAPPAPGLSEDDAALSDMPQLRDAEFRGLPVRVAYLWVPIAGAPQPALVQVAETREKRSVLATEIIKGVMLPQFAILPLAVLLVWLALVRGIRPLSELESRIRARRPDDLSPLDDHAVPQEVAPLVASVNDLLTRLKDSIATQKRFLADAAHQLKTPLAGLRMQAELAQREGASEEELKQSLQQIGLASVRATHTVNQLLALARAEGGSAALAHEPCDLAALTIEVVRQAVPTALEHGTDLGYEGPEPGAPHLVRMGNPVLLKEMLRNLVENALHYARTPGTGAAVVTVRLRANPPGGGLALEVEDNGPGVPAAERELVFQPFYRVLGTNVDGTGLGLPIVREIAEQHGASVSLSEARPGQQPPGARFVVRFMAPA